MKRKQAVPLSTTKKRTRAQTEQIEQTAQLVTLLLQLLEHNLTKLLRARR